MRNNNQCISPVVNKVSLAHYMAIKQEIMLEPDAHSNGKVYYRSGMKWEEKKEEVLC